MSIHLFDNICVQVCERSPGLAAVYLLYHDDIRAEHFKTSGEEHDVAPAEDQAHGHHLGLRLHLGGSEHTQQHHQARIGDTERAATRLEILQT